MRKAAVAAVLAVLLALVAGGCGGLIGNVAGTESALRQAGFGSVGVTPSGDDLHVSVHVDRPATAGNVLEVGSIVWRNFHERFGVLRITVHGSAGPALHSSPTFAEMQGRFGPRDPAWNRTDVHSSTITLGVVALGLLAGGVIVVVVVVVLSRRRRRRRRGGPWQAGGRPPWAPQGEPVGKPHRGSWPAPPASGGWGPPPGSWEPPPGSRGPPPGS